MDKLNEPEFQTHERRPRLKMGVKDYIKNKEYGRNEMFVLLAAATIGRYYREVYFYMKNTGKFAAIVPLFIFSSYQVARTYYLDAHAYAALINNENEEEYHQKVGDMWRAAKRNNTQVPNDIVNLL